MIAMVRVTAEISDEMEVEVPDGSSDEEIIAAAHADWSFVEASSWGEEILSRSDS